MLKIPKKILNTEYEHLDVSLFPTAQGQYAI